MKKATTPDGWHTITPRILCPDTPALLEFLRVVFDADAEYKSNQPSIAKIGDSQIMVSSTDARELASAFLYLYVENADAVFRKAIAASAVPIEEPAPMHYGERRCMFADPWGNTWQVANL